MRDWLCFRKASFVALAGARDANLRRNITWLDERSVFVQLSSVAELQAATAAVDTLLAEGSFLPWGPASRFGTYESFLRCFADVFGAVCDLELLPPADDEKADKKRRREPDAPAAEMASPVLPVFASDAVGDLSAEPVDVPPTA